jgi:hypothetical protein
MDWDQIESKWTAMARRIRADVQCGKIGDGVDLHRRAGSGEAAKTVVAKQISSPRAEITRERSLVSTR